ncbi:MAG: GNAT family N-acetyltransferase [Anaerolineaceae bacterium]
MELQNHLVMTIELPPGYQALPMSLEYAEETVALLNEITEEFSGSPKLSLDGMIGEWQFPEVDLDSHTRIVRSPQGKIIAYGELWDIFKPYVHKNVYVRVHRDHRGLGIGSWLLEFAESQAVVRVDLAPMGKKVTMKASTFGNDHAATDLLISHGFTRARVYYTMKIRLDKPPQIPRIPDGIVIRPIEREVEEEAFFRAAQEAFRDHYGFVEEPFEDYYRRWQRILASDHECNDPVLWLAAMDGNEIAGICYNRLQIPHSTELGWVSMLGVRRPWRRKGIAEALLLQSFHRFYERGYQWVGLGVDAASLTGATRLYEKVGMKVVNETFQFWKVLREGEEIGSEHLDG